MVAPADDGVARDVGEAREAIGVEVALVRTIVAVAYEVGVVALEKTAVDVPPVTVDCVETTGVTSGVGSVTGGFSRVHAAVLSASNAIDRRARTRFIAQPP